ncbi:MAG: hypothetical protein HY053_02965 [Proteobacteria bacterium]|nr:hypothetical protein [Pseudomonadota bacterium]
MTPQAHTQPAYTKASAGEFAQKTLRSFSEGGPSLSGKLLLIVSDLSGVLEDEVGLLEKRDYGRHPEILRRKQELTLNYQNSLKALGEGPGKSTLNPQERESLTIAGQKLEAVTQRNAEALRLAEASTDRLLQTMMEEIRKELHKESNYSSQAVLSAAEKGVMRPIAVNRKV